MKVSPHNHVESPLTSSTIDTMIQRAKSLGRTHFAYTDLGHLSSALKTYSLAKKNGLKFIPGIEFYFKDTSCPFVGTTSANRCKYFTATLYCEDQTAYQELVKLISSSDFPTVDIYEEKQQLWAWENLKHIAKFNVNLILSGVHCMVGKTMLAGEAKAAENVFLKLQEIFGDRLFTAITCDSWTKKWNSVIQIELTDGKKVSCLTNDTVTTDKARRMRALDLVERPGHGILKSMSCAGIGKEINQGIVEAKLHKGFLPLPGGDALFKVNRFLLALSRKYSVKTLVTDYAYYATKEDKIVQTMRMEGTNKLQPNFYMKSEEEVKDYLTNVLGANEALIQQFLGNLNEWADRFDKLELKYEWRLADSGPDPLNQAMEIIKKNGRMKWDDPKYVNRLKEELEVISKNPIKDLTPYFLPIRDVLNHYEENGLLAGPGRGSAGGSLFCYLLGITQINPFKYDLPFSRFFSLDRIMMKELPDIDVDLESRELLVGEDGHSGYLYGHYGDKAAQISTRTTIRLKSAIKDTNRYFNGKVEPAIETFSKGLPPPPQGVNDHQFVFGYEDSDGEHIPGLIEQSEDLQKYAETRPKEWEIVSKAMGLTRAFSRHACFAKDTLVDNNGKVSTIENAKFVIDKPITTWSSGVRDTIIVCFNNGISIRCTPNHKFIVDGQSIEAKDLLGKTVSYKPFSNVSGTKSLGKDLLFALGWGLNDGTFNKLRHNQCFHFTPGKDDEARDKITKFLTTEGVKIWNGRTDELYCGKKELNRLFFESKKNNEQRLPSYFWNLTLESQLEFMKGLFSANGYVLNTRKRVGIKLASRLLGNDISVWLNAIGIKTSATFIDSHITKAYGRVFVSNGHVELSINGHISRLIFASKIGFLQTYKMQRLMSITKEKHPKDSHENKIRLVRCLSIYPSTPTEVFDFNEPKENVGHINGILAHNSAFVLSDVPIKDIVPTKDGNVAQYEAKECEAAGLIKYDFLVINQLKDVRVCLDLINKKNGKYRDPKNPQEGTNKVGWFDHNGESTYIWDLPELDDVFKSIWNGSVETLFQINTKSMAPNVVEILPGCMMDIATVQALVRPGPMDFIDEKTGRNMVQEYILRKRGESTPDIKELANLLPETYGIIVFQEQLNKIARDLAGFPGEKAEKVRKNMAKKKMKELMDMKPSFVQEGLKRSVAEDVIEAIWERMVTFGRYGFSVIHAVEYAHITYACMFLKHYYPLEWWAAVLTNAEEQEITGVLWPFVKDKVSPPDINLSSDTMVVDYGNSLIRSKMGVIHGIGEATIEPIVNGRPYKDIQDFVDKEVAGASLSHKLIHVGVLDSLFPPKTNFLEKLKLYEDAVEKKKYHQKLAKAEKEGKKIRATQPKEGKIPEDYVGLHPIKDAAMRKSVLPSLFVNLYELGKNYSKVKLTDFGIDVAAVESVRGYSTPLISGEKLKRLDEIDGESIEKDYYVAATCFVVKAEEFSYPKKNPTKRALKMILDCDGFVSEKVLWPDYETGQLIYPPELKRGAIATVFFRKKTGRKDMNIMSVTVET